MKDVKDMTFDEWLKMWSDLNKVFFDEEEIKEFEKQDKPRNEALRKLWKVKGFNTVGEYETWEKEHIAERNEFIRRELNAQSK